MEFPAAISVLVLIALVSFTLSLVCFSVNVYDDVMLTVAE